MTAHPGRFARDRLPTIDGYLRSIGIDLPGRGTERRCKCPIVEHGSKQPFSVNLESGVWHCFACDVGGGDSLALHQARTGQTFLEAACDLGALVDEDRLQHGPPRAAAPPRRMPNMVEERIAAEKRRSAAEIWRSSVQLSGTPGEAYLVGRGCRLPPADGDLRFLPRLDLFGFDSPCLVGRISRGEDASQGIGLHLTWLVQAESSWHRSKRRYLGRKAGGVVRLWPQESVTAGLAIAEGIETALAAAHAYAPIWAAMDAGNLARFPAIQGIEALTIFADRDPSGTGQEAAADCADRWLDAGREVLVMLPDTVGTDIADEVTA